MNLNSIFLVVCLCSLNFIDGQLITGWETANQVNSKSGVDCKVRWDSNGFNIGVYFDSQLQISDSVYLAFNLDTTKSTAGGSDAYNFDSTLLLLPFQADYLVSIHMSNPTSVVFQQAQGGSVWDFPYSAVAFQHFANSTCIELITNDTRFFSQAGVPLFNFLAIFKNSTLIAPVDGFFGFFQTVTIPPNSPSFINSFPYWFNNAGNWKNDSYWFYQNVPFTTDTIAQNVFINAPCLLDLPQVTIGHLHLKSGIALNLNGKKLQVGNGSQEAIVSFESGSSVLSGEFQLQAPAQISAPDGYTVPVTTLKASGSGTVSGASTLIVGIKDKLSVISDVVVNFAVVYENTSVLEYNSDITGSQKYVSGEWIPTQSQNASVPNRVNINQIDFHISSTSYEEWMVKGNLGIGQGSVTLHGNSVLNVGGTLSVGSGCSLTAELDSKIYAKIIDVGNGATISCAGSSMFEWDFNTNSYKTFPVLNVTTSDGIQVTSQFAFTGNMELQLDETKWESTSWYSELGGAQNWLGDTNKINLTAMGNYSVLSEYIGTGCLSTFNFLLVPPTSPVASVSPVASASASPQSASSSPKSGGIGTTAIVAIVVALVGAAMVGAIIGFVIWKKKPAKKSEEEQDENDYEVSQIQPTNQDQRASVKTKSNEIDYTEIKIGPELGRGAFGVVFKAKWRNTDVVVKQMDTSKQDEHSIKQFLKETTNVQNARLHPNVCAVFGVCTDPKYPACIVMEYVGGGSLDNLLYHHEIEVDGKIAVEFAKNIAGGMSHLHQENILHCDLAARNLLVSQQDGKYVLKISDFGLSKVTEADLYVSTSSTFPIRWTPPEALRGGKITRAFDVWSFGVVMWEIIECKKPYPDLTNAEVINQVCDHGYRLPRPQRVPIPDELYNLMQRCWAEKPENRPTFNEIYEELETIYQKYYGEDSDSVDSDDCKKTEVRRVAPVTSYSSTQNYENSQPMYGNHS